ncbi:MAG: hypothetical protein JJU34_05885 [Lunatimonas sp.]|uniref:hypothetical protein n=1 Tax=Lunatimonas sp. TaxID=2060141 RepID=UPI00263AB11F|nr:hypothetical protein [Lunatimonas sp.]MCC5936791.1 hypothetical protein [Lunatimonas sp.]
MGVESVGNRNRQLNIEKKPTKVGFIIFTQLEQGLGGHYRSLKTHYDSFKQAGIISNDSFIINFGKAHSEVLKESENFNFIKTNITLTFISKLFIILKEKKPDIIHCYDLTSLQVIKLINIKQKWKLLYTKCGGPNLEFYFDVPTILFSKENYEDIIKKEKRKAPLYLIPNRIKDEVDTKNSPVKLDLSRNTLNILRINRISTKYLEVIRASINLTNRLNSSGIKTKLYIVGSIETPETYETIKNIKANTILLTDKEYVTNASQLINQFDIVIGTGRTAMESMQYGKPTLGFTKTQSIPIIITENNIETFLHYNFSERTIIEEINETEELSNIIDLVKNLETTNTRHFFDKYFNVKTKLQKYREIYDTIPYTVDRQKVSKGFLLLVKKLYRSI